MIFLFTYLPSNLWIKFPSTVVLTFQRCIRNPPEDLLKHSCWTLIESFRFSRLSGIWWSAFLTTPWWCWPCWSRDPMLRTAAPVKGEYEVTGIVNWEVQEGPSSYFIFSHPVLHVQGLRAKVRGLIQDTARNLEPEQRRALPGEKADPWGWRASHLADKQKGLNLQPDPLFWVNTLQGRLCKHALSTGGLRTSKAGWFFFFSSCFLLFAPPLFLSTEKSH